MKKTLLLLSVFVAAAIAFVGCQKENNAPVKTHKVTIFATQDDAKTTVTEEEGKAVFTWTDEDMDNFHIFENGVAATTIVAEHQDGKVTILAEFPEQVAASYVYSGYLAGSTAQDGKCPAVGTEQTLGTTLYASSADVLVAEPQESATVATELNFSFKRPVAVSKMTIKNIPAGENVEKVTIKSDKPLAGYFDMAEDAWVSGGNSIDVIVNKTVPEGDSIEVGFVTIPVEEATFTVKASTYSKDFAKTFAKTLSLPDGRLVAYKVNMSGCEAPFFYESFDKCDGTGGNDGSWSGSIAGVTLNDSKLDNAGWEYEKGNAAYECAKFGTSSVIGTVTTPALGIRHNQNTTVSFKAGAWSGDKTTIALELVGNGFLSETELEIADADWTDCSVVISGGDENTKLKISASQPSKNRFFLDEVKAEIGGEFSYLYISPADTTVASTATKAEIAVTANGAWTAVSTKGNTIAPASGTGNAEVVLSFAANTTSAEYKDTVTFTCGDKVKKFYLTQQPGAMQTKTIAEFIDLADTENAYQLTGIVTGISFKNFNLTDATGTIYVYSFGDEINFVNGDKLTLYGKYQYYEAQSKHEVVSGKYVSHVTTPKLSVDKSAIEVADDETSATFNILGTAKWTITSSNPVVTLSKTSGTGAAEITLEFPENTSTTDAVTATITVSSEDEDVYASPCEISFTQAKKEAGTLTTVDLPSSTTFTYSGSGTTGILTYNHSDFTIVQAKGTSGTNVGSGNNTVGTLRVYTGNTLTFTSDYTIKKIEFTYTGSYSGGTISANTGVMSGQVWTGTSKNVVLSPSSQWRTATIKVTYLSTAAPTVWNLSGIAVTTPPNKTSYAVGETLDLTGMVVTATYSDEAGVKADKQVVVTEWTADPAEGTALSTEGDVTVTVSYTDGVTKTATQKVTVSEGPKTYSCAFNSKSWGIATGGTLEWTSDNDAYQYTSPNVQVTAAKTGAGATTKTSYTNISKIQIKASTTGKGVGNITVKVGDGAAQTICSLSKNTTATFYTLDFATPVSGKVTFVVNCSTNSMYVQEAKITAE